MVDIARVTQNDFDLEDRLAEMRQKQPRDLYAEARVFGEATAGWFVLAALTVNEVTVYLLPYVLFGLAGIVLWFDKSQE